MPEFPNFPNPLNLVSMLSSKVNFVENLKVKFRLRYRIGNQPTNRFMLNIKHTHTTSEHRMESTLHLRKFMNAIFTENLFKKFAGKRFEPFESSERDYKVTMRLTIHSVTQHDFGSYRCVSKNSLGDTDGQIKLYRKYLCYVCRHNNYFYYFHRIIAIFCVHMQANLLQ